MSQNSVPEVLPDVELRMVRCVLTPDVAKQSYATRTFLEMKRAAAGKAKDSDGEKKRIRPEPVWIVPGKSLRQLIARNAGIRAQDVGDISLADELSTDAALARGITHREPRELEAWVPEGDDAEFLTLEESAKSERGWDQFKVNESVFGIRTTFDEDVYTTRLNKDGCNITEEEANRLAKEIEGKLTTNPHQMEERGQALDAFGEEVDEEELYSSVKRDPAREQRANEVEPPRPKEAAWSKPGVGVSMLAGKPTKTPQSVPMSVPTGSAASSGNGKEKSSEFIQQEHRRLRQHLTNPKPSGTTVGSPGNRYALKSPLVSNPTAVQALNLEPGVPKLEAKAMQEFQKFKQEEEAKKRKDAESERDSKKKELQDFAAQLRLKEKKTSSDQLSAKNEGTNGTSVQQDMQAEEQGKLNPNAKPFSFNPNAKAFVLPKKKSSPTMDRGSPTSYSMYMPASTVPNMAYSPAASMGPLPVPHGTPAMSPPGRPAYPVGHALHHNRMVPGMMPGHPMMYVGSPPGGFGTSPPFVPPPSPPSGPPPRKDAESGT
mmetsp:Transcript_11192/g.69079  ORF Transcript_11192/g.69079 Transcript_11192/m.69079 type:complete len:545 (+) Transcript_11192:603-2237(+)